MTLSEMQRAFVKRIGMLINFAYKAGYELTFGDGKAKSGHMPGSLHYIGLAQDLNLFKDGVYLTKSEDHLPLGEYWEDIGNEQVPTRWGGRFKDEEGNPDPDGNHYSVEWEGKK